MSLTIFVEDFVKFSRLVKGDTNWRHAKMRQFV